MKKRMKYAAVVMAAMLLSGCGVEVNERVFVNSVYVDETSGGVFLAAEYSDGENSEVKTSAGENIVGAVENLSDMLGKDVFFGHCKAVFLSENTSGLYDKTKYFLTDGRIAGDAIVCVCPDEGILYADNLGTFSEVAAKATDEGKIPDGRIIPVTATLDSDEKTALLPLATVRDGSISLCGGGVFVDGKFSTLLSDDETTGAAILGGSAKNIVIDEGGAHINAEICDVSQETANSRNGAVMRVKIKVKGNASGVDEAEADRICEEKINNCIMSAVMRAKRENADFVGCRMMSGKNGGDNACGIADTRYSISSECDIQCEGKY